jgi:hypothetical protein
LASPAFTSPAGIPQIEFEQQSLVPHRQQQHDVFVELLEELELELELLDLQQLQLG